MSTTIDEKVVEMRFDNGQFEQGVSQSMSSIDKLKQALNFDGVSGQAGQAVNVMVSGFDALGSAMKRVIENITDSAWAKFASMINSLTIAPIASGWQKYGTLMDSVQTIMSATRQDWEDQTEQMEFMTSQIEKLNWYTDETSWNMVDMTSNIGKFVAAGVDIETATVAMEGIGSWAGQSGAKVDQMSRAMYNLSQAMAMGSVRVQDWMSIENANMATKEFKETAIQTALAIGELTEKSDGTIVAYDKFGKEVEVTAETFRSTLASGWFTGEVLTSTLKKYGDFADGLHKTVEETGLTATELLGHIDDYKEAMENGEDMTTWVQELAAEENVKDVKALAEGLEYLSSDYNELGRSAFKASQECKTFKDLQLAMEDATSSAWMGIFQAIVGNYLESKELWSAWAEELYEVFVDPLNDIKRMFMDFGDFGGREGFLQVMWNVWYNIKDIIMSVKEGLETMFPASTALSLLKIIYNLRDFTESIRFVDFPWYSDLDNIRDAVANVVSVFKNLWTNVKIIASAIGKAWSQIFPDDPKALTITEILRDVTDWLKRMSDSLIFTDEQTAKLERTFAGLFAVVDILKEVIIAIIEPFAELEGFETGLTDGALDVTASIGDMLVQFRDWLKENNVLRNTIGNFVRFVLSIPDKLDKLCQDLFGIGLDQVWINIKDAASTAWTYIVDFFTNLPTYADEACQALFGMHLDEVWTNVKEAVSGAWETIKQFFASLRGGNETSEVSETTGELGETIQSTGETVSNTMDKISDGLSKFKEAWEVVKPYFDEIIQGFKDSTSFEMPTLDEWGKGLAGGGLFVFLIGITDAIVAFTSAFKDLSKDKDTIVKSVTGMFNSIGGAFKSLSKRISADTVKVVATAILEIAAAIFILSIIDQGKMAASTAVITGMLVMLTKVMEKFDTLTMDKSKFKQIRKTLKDLMVVIAEITAALILVAREDTNGVIAAAIAIGVLLGEVALIIAKLSEIDDLDPKKMQGAAAAAVILGVVLLEIAASLKILEGIPVESLITGTIALAALLGILCVALVTIGDAKGDLKKAAASSIVMGVTLLEIAVALKILGDIPVLGLIAGAIALSAILIIMCIALSALAKSEGNLFKGAAAAIVMGVALVEIAAALAIIGKIPVGGLIAGAIALSAVLMVLTIALSILAQSEGNLLKGAAALAVAAVGLILIAGALFVINQVVEGGHIWETLILLAGALAIVLVAALGAQYVAAGLIALGGAIALIGAGALMAGAGLLMFATAVEKIASVGPDAVLDLLMGLTLFFSMVPMFAAMVAMAIVNMIAVFVNSKDIILEGIVTLFDIILTAIGTVLPKVFELIGGFIVGLIDLIISIMPKIIELIRVIFNAIITLVQEQVPVIVDTFIMIVQELLRSIMVLTPQITEVLMAIIIDTLTQLAENIAPIVSLLIQIAIGSILGLIDGLAAKIPDIIDSIMNFILSLINGIADGLDKYTEPLREAVIKLCNSVINAVKEFFGIHSPSTVMSDMGNNIIQGLINGISDFIGKAKEKIEEVADKMLTAICDFFGVNKPESQQEFLLLGKNIMQGLIDGINKMISDVTSVITGVADSVVGTFKNVLGIQSPSKVFRSFGRYIDEGLAEGIDEYSGDVRNSSEDLGKTAIDSMSSAISSITDLIDGEIDSDVTIRPVLDLSNVTSGAHAIDNMLSSDRSLSLAMNSSADVNSRLSSQHNTTSALDSLKTAISGLSKNGTSIINNHTWNISGSDPRAIADEISSILQNDIERTNAVWE